MSDDGSQQVGYSLRPVDPPHAEEQGKGEGKGQEQQKLSHDPEYKGADGISQGNESVLVYHLKAQHQDS